MLVPGSANPLLLRTAAAPAAEGISRSLRFNAPDSAYLSRTPASAGNRRTWTWAGWVKRSALGGDQQLFFAAPSVSDTTHIRFDSDNTLAVFDYAGSFTWQIKTSQVFRDVSAWFHLCVAVDTTSGTASNRVKVYVNGSQVTALGTASYPSQNHDTEVSNNVDHRIGINPYFGNALDGYLADIHFIDGQALDPTSFGEFSATTGVWMPKAYSGSYGTNGFHLDFSDNSTAAALGTDSSGAGNNWTPLNLSINSGGPTSVASASGALPVYNTTDTYGTTKGTGTRTDSNSSSIVLAIPMDGANNGTTFTDESATIKGSGSAKTITRYGDTKTVTSLSKYYGSSGFFDGTGDYLELAASSDFSFGSGNFTIECWLYANNTSNCDIFGYYSGGGLGFIVGNPYGLGQTAGTISIFDDRAGGDVLNAPGGTVVTGVWTHIAAVRNGSDLRIYKDGISVASKTTSATSFGDSTNAYGIGRMTGSLARNVNGYLQDFRVYKGVAKYTGNFNPPSSTQNATVAAGNDSLVDVPTNGSEVDTGSGGQVRGNYCTWNPLAKGSDCTLSNGNLDVAWGSAGSTTQGSATFGMSSGKWYWETTITASSASPTNAVLGITTKPFGDSEYPGYSATSWGYRGSDGQKWNNTSGASYGASYANGDVVSVAFDADNGTLTFYKNGSSQGIAFTGLTSGPYFPAIGDQSSSQTFSAATNFGARSFAYTAPSGFKALNTSSLPAPVITKPSEYMDVKLYTGNGSTQTISGLGFSPDFVWLKARSAATAHLLFDQIRGATYYLSSNATDAESNSPSNTLTAFNSDGFTLGSNSSANGSSVSLTAWTWDAGSSTVTNTAGSISSQVRANASAGFSVVTFSMLSGTYTVGHGLNVAPSLLITKGRTFTSNWWVYHASLGSSQYLGLNSTAAASSLSWGGSPTSSVFTANNNFFSNGQDYVVYAFAPVAGYSAFGSYTGNGSADGPFVYCGTGFRPRWVLIKVSSTTNEWRIYDAARLGYNTVATILTPNSSQAEGTTGSPIDLLSNGFKLRGTDVSINSNGDTYIYAAFAESPFNFSRAR